MKINYFKPFLRLVTISLLAFLPIWGFSQSDQIKFMEVMDIKIMNLSPEQLLLVDKIKGNCVTQSIYGLKIEKISTVVYGNKGTLPIELPDFLDCFEAIPKKFEYFSDDDYKWYGSFEELPGEISIRCKGGIVHGRISVPDKGYEFRSLGKGMYILIEYNMDRLNQGVDLAVKPPLVKMPLTTQNLLSPVEIDVLILYTPHAEDYCSDLNMSIEDHAEYCVDQLQDALDISVPDGDVTISIAGVEEFDFEEQWSDIEADWDSLYTYGQSRRNSTDADLVVLITDADETIHTGYYDNELGYIYGNAGPSAGNLDEATAFAIVEANFAYNNYSFAHEIGHLLGCDHEGGSGYNHGYY